MNRSALALLSLLLGALTPGAAAGATFAASVQLQYPAAARFTSPEWPRARLLPDEGSPAASCTVRLCGEKPPERLRYGLLGYVRERPEEMLRELTSHLSRDPVVTTAAEWLTTRRIQFDLRASQFVVAFRLPAP